MGSEEQMEFQDTQENLEYQVVYKVYLLCVVTCAVWPLIFFLFVFKVIREVRWKYQLVIIF